MRPGLLLLAGLHGGWRCWPHSWKKPWHASPYCCTTPVEREWVMHFEQCWFKMASLNYNIDLICDKICTTYYMLLYNKAGWSQWWSFHLAGEVLSDSPWHCFESPCTWGMSPCPSAFVWRICPAMKNSKPYDKITIIIQYKITEEQGDEHADTEIIVHTNIS